MGQRGRFSIWKKHSREGGTCQISKKESHKVVWLRLLLKPTNCKFYPTMNFFWALSLATLSKRHMGHSRTTRRMMAYDPRPGSSRRAQGPLPSRIASQLYTLDAITPTHAHPHGTHTHTLPLFLTLRFLHRGSAGGKRPPPLLPHNH